ncbi:MAG TPA: kelch repeat-containing protein [Planctomycetota bacterium]|nr:kelch repeat-containing protein [Planctomycetota bacterium]
MRRLLLPLAILLAACGGGGGGGGGPPASGPLDVVRSVDPAPGADGVDPAGVVVTIEFRTPMDPDTLVGGTLLLTPAGSTAPVAADVAVAFGNMSATLTPRGPLTADRHYQVRLSEQARLQGGREIRRPWYSLFRTGGGAPPPPPPPPQTGSVFAAAALETGRSGHAAVLLADGRVAVFGGFATSSTVTDSIEVYDPAAEAWTTAPGVLNPARARLTATRLQDGRVLLAGGETASTTDVGVDRWEIWDPATGGIATSGTLAERRTRHRAVGLADGTVLLIGGARTDASGAPLYSRSSVERFDPSAPGSSAAPAMGVSRAGHEATLLADGRVLVTGGHGSSLTAEVRDASTGAWSAAGAMTQARRDHAAALLLDGSVLVAGGGTFTAELWVPAAGAFYPLQNMGDTRSLHTALRIASGRVFVAGGEKPTFGGGLFFHTATEFYNPSTGSFLFPNLPSRVGRSGHTATLMATGDVLVVGGKSPTVGTPAVRLCDRFQF